MRFFNIREHLIIYILSFILFGCQGKTEKAVQRAPKDLPNIIYILADDMGYGDLQCYNLDSKVPTPNIDKLALEGVRFTDAHSPSAVCTPTRYGILTGQYCWRSPLKKGVLLGYSRPIISPDQETVASFLKKAGYYTACIGKWHLGLGWALKDGSHYDAVEELYEDNEIAEDEVYIKENVDYTQPVTGGPNQLGFDYSFILPASLDFEPYCYLENGMVLDPPVFRTDGHDLNTGYTEAFWRPGNISEGFEFDQVLPRFADTALEFIRERKTDPDTPFFLYLPLAAPHTPWVPAEDFKNASEAGTYGDFVNMVDHYVGKIMNELDALSLTENTLVIFTSDNGAFWKDDYRQKYDHLANYHFRGMKADVWEGGHRVPFIARWPGITSPATTDSTLLCLTDLMRTVSEIVGIDVPENAGMDSKSFLPYLKGENHRDMDRTLILHSSRGLFAIRKNTWKYIEGSGGGGFGFNESDRNPGDTLHAQLYNLETDIYERENLLNEYPEVLNEISSYLESARENK